MAIRYVQGNLIELALDGRFDVIAHGCNCQHTMGAGVALHIANNFPEAVEVDLATPKGDTDKLGSISVAMSKTSKGGSIFIANCYTQEFYGRGKVQVDYEAIRRCMIDLRANFSGLRIGMPRIGAGLAGGDWKRISCIIHDILKDEDVSVVVLPDEWPKRQG